MKTLSHSDSSLINNAVNLKEIDDSKTQALAELEVLRKKILSQLALTAPLQRSQEGGHAAFLNR